ncbi:MAG: AAA family ATPase [Spirochaetia bacterium]|nr:AAA family ATPase [Spirochaetia bacterium]
MTEENQFEEESAVLQSVKEEMAKAVIGQEAMTDRLLIALICGGHVLLEGVPGLAKTLAVSTLARILDVDFKRIQFTPDLLPSDLIGTLIYNPQKGTFSVKKGPVFANIVLADEINRAPAKVQSALLECMQEYQVTLGDETFALPGPFMVLATQNPVDQEGTYPLPEAQVDRFFMKLNITYPERDEEIRILETRSSSEVPQVRRGLVSAESVLKLQPAADSVYLDDKLKGYIVDLVRATRNPETVGAEKLAPLISFGASPRAAIALARASRAAALLRGRNWVQPDDIAYVAPDVLRHRVILSYEAMAEGKTSDDVIAELQKNCKIVSC